MQRSRATIEDVARLAGVHASTASRVLRGVASQSVAPATRQRIVEAAAELNYQANAFARGLRLQRTNTIALLSPYLESLGFSEIARGVLDGASERGFLVVTAIVGSDNEASVFRQLIDENRVDGLVAAFGLLKDPILTAAAQSGVPLVTVNRRVRGIKASVVVEDGTASRLAVTHLHSLGHRRLAHIAGQDGTDTSERRKRGFRDACKRLRLVAPAEVIVSGQFSVDGGAAAAERLMSLPHDVRPTAIVVADPMSALGAIKRLQTLGHVVPDDVSIVALNDHLVTDFVEPPLTTVKLPFSEMGRAASGMVLDMIDGGAARELVISEPAPFLMVRESTAPCAV